MINQILSQLGVNSKITVGVSVSPGVGLEMLQVDKTAKTVYRYACKPLEYDYSKREIADYDKFRETLVELFDELGISKKSNIVLSIPSVVFGMLSLPTILEDDAIKNSIISEVEQNSYIFKRQEAVVSWADAYPNGNKENRDVLYGVIQQTALDEIQAACLEIGCKLVAIETSYLSLLKTISHNDLATEQMQPNVPWNLMIINQNSYAMISLSGKDIIEFREEPLALKSFSGDEIYSAIVSSAQLALQTSSSNYLYIVSETDLVSAEVLSIKMPYDGSIRFIESNKYVQTPIMQASYDILPNLIVKITPEVIGAGIYRIADYPLRLNLLGQKETTGMSGGVDDVIRFNIGNIEFELLPEVIKKFALILELAIVIPCVLILLLFNFIQSKETEIMNNIQNELTQIQAELSKYSEADKKSQFDPLLETRHITALNKTRLMYYSAIGLNLPEKTWLTYLNFSDKNTIDLIGRSTNINNIYTFYKGLKMSVINSDLKLNKLEMSSDAISRMLEDIHTGKPTFYEFEITNMTPEELAQQTSPVATNTGENATVTAGVENQETVKQRIKGYMPDDFFATDYDIQKNNENAANGSTSEPPKNLPANLEKIENF